MMFKKFGNYTQLQYFDYLFFKIKGVDINLITKFIRNEDYILSKKELEIFDEYKQYLYVYEFYNDELVNISKILKKNLLIKKNFNKSFYKGFLLLNKIFEDEVNKLDSIKEKNFKFDETITFEFLSILLLSIFNNNFISYKDVCSSDQKKYDFYNSYDILNEFHCLFINFMIFFTKKNYNGDESIYFKKLIFFILKTLETENILIKKLQNSVKNKKIKNNKVIFYSLNFEKKYLFFINLNIGIKFNPPVLNNINNDIFYYGYYYLSVYKINKNNLYNSKSIIINNNTALTKLTNLKYKLDVNYYYDLKNFIIKKNNLNIDDPLKDLIIKYNDNKPKFYLKNLQKKNSEYYNLIIFFTLEKYINYLGDFFYLVPFVDFRGRIYTHSSISPSGNKIFRYLYNYGCYTNDELNLLEIELNKKYSQHFDKCLVNMILNNTDIQLHYKNLNFEKNYLKEILRQCFIELGKIFKSSYIDKYDGKMSEFDFIKIGIDVYNCYFLNKKLNNKDFNFDNILDIEYVLNIVKNYNLGLNIKSIIYKDVTASAIQLLTILFKTNDYNNLKICNLTDSNFWFDTYYHIIKLFFENEGESISDLFKNLASRKNLKKSIMIYNYSATFITSFRDFLSNIKFTPFEWEKHGKIITNDFKKFYDFLYKLFRGNKFFISPPIELIEVIMTGLIKTGELKLITTDNCIIYLEYYKFKNIRVDNKINKTRQTIVLNYISDEIDLKKTHQAFIANLIHSCDAEFVRILINKLGFGIITIHDCFGIDILNVDLLIQTANISINSLKIVSIFDEVFEPKENKYYSKYILL